ncbi:hypothetical protein [Shewanella sp.]|uniref:hypothetical protein n=1 Tax=Shewanella sp. TaxID=50422 RepID=UPI003D11F8EA
MVLIVDGSVLSWLSWALGFGHDSVSAAVFGLIEGIVGAVDQRLGGVITAM